MAIITLFGMFIFVLFGGVGLFALPIDYIHAFTRRPRIRSVKERNDTKKGL